MTYSKELKHPKWQKKRLEILSRDNFTCKLCGDTESMLSVHHMEYCNGKPWDVDSKFLITLCQDCHDVVERISKSKDTKIGLFDFNSNVINTNKIVFDESNTIIFANFIDTFYIFTKIDGVFDTYSITGNGLLTGIQELLNISIKFGQ